MNPEYLLLKYVDPNGITRGMHLDDGTGAPVCGRPAPTTYNGRGKYVPFVLASGHRESVREYRQRIGHMVSVCGHCLHKAGWSDTHAPTSGRQR